MTSKTDITDIWTPRGTDAVPARFAKTDAAHHSEARMAGSNGIILRRT